MAGAAGHDTSDGQKLQELEPRPGLDVADRHDGNVDQVILQRRHQIGQVAMTLPHRDIGLGVLEARHHPADHRVHEEGDTPTRTSSRVPVRKTLTVSVVRRESTRIACPCAASGVACNGRLPLTNKA